MKQATLEPKLEEKEKFLNNPLSMLKILRAKMEKRRNIINGTTISRSNPQKEIKKSIQQPILEIKDQLDFENKSVIIKKPGNLNQQEYITIFQEIVRRMINAETSNKMISLQEKDLNDAVIYYENLINTGKNSQGKLIHFSLAGEFISVGEVLIKPIVEIINFHCSTLESITLQNNYIDSSALEILFSSLKLNSALSLSEIDIWQFPNLSGDCIKIILEQLKTNISLKVIYRREIDAKTSERTAWKSVDDKLDYNIEFKIAKKALPILISLLPKDIVQSIVMDFLLGELSQRTDKPFYFDGEDDKFLKQMQTEKPGVKTLSMLKVTPKYLEKYILAFIERHHLTLQCLCFPTLGSAILFNLSLFDSINSFLTELDISEDKSPNLEQLSSLLAYLNSNCTLKRLILAPNLNLPSQQTRIKEQIEAELSYNEQLGVAHVALPIFLEIFKEFNNNESDSPSRSIMSFLLGDELYPQRLNKGVSFDLSGLTVFGKKFRQPELLATETATRLNF